NLVAPWSVAVKSRSRGWPKYPADGNVQTVGMSYEEWEFSGLATKQLYRYTGLYCRWENCGKMCCIAWMTMTPIWMLSYRYIWESTQGNHVDPENWDR